MKNIGLSLDEIDGKIRRLGLDWSIMRSYENGEFKNGYLVCINNKGLKKWNWYPFKKNFKKAEALNKVLIMFLKDDLK